MAEEVEAGTEATPEAGTAQNEGVQEQVEGTEKTQEATGQETKDEPGAPPKSLVNQAKAEAEPVAEPAVLDQLKLPEGLKLDEAQSKAFLDIVNDSVSSRQELAQKLVELYGQQTQSAADAAQKSWLDTREKWVEQFKSDPELGGTKAEATLTRLSKLIDQYGSDELRDVFDSTGAGDHPVMIKFLDKIAGKLLEGTPLQGGATSLQVPTNGMTIESISEQLFSTVKN